MMTAHPVTCPIPSCRPALDRTVHAPSLPPAVAVRLAVGDIDVLAFAWSSTVRNFVELLGGPPDPRIRVASIGPVTTETATTSACASPRRG